MKSLVNFHINKGLFYKGYFQIERSRLIMEFIELPETNEETPEPKKNNGNNKENGTGK